MRRILAIIFGISLPLITQAAGYHITNSGWNCAGFVGCSCAPGAVCSDTPPPLAAFLTAKIVALVFPTGGGMGFIFYLTVVVFFYGSLRLVFSRGEEGKEAGKKAMQYAALGFVLALLIAGIMRFFCDYVYGLGSGSVSFSSVTCQQWWP